MSKPFRKLANQARPSPIPLPPGLVRLPVTVPTAPSGREGRSLGRARHHIRAHAGAMSAIGPASRLVL